ncbi:MAG: 30S ribosomal protein S2 [Planctomycetes bacterium]|nr:30S ribosomal protein S2 [Planctomycetota bacterium]
MTEELKATNLADMLVESGVHFGHRVANWNPKMKDYIFGKRNKIHIINIRETIKGIIRAQHLLKGFVADGKINVLFVGTKRQAKDTICKIGLEKSLAYVSERWLGGTLTNFEVVR